MKLSKWSPQPFNQQFVLGLLFWQDMFEAVLSPPRAKSTALPVDFDPVIGYNRQLSTSLPVQTGVFNTCAVKNQMINILLRFLIINIY